MFTQSSRRRSWALRTVSSLLERTRATRSYRKRTNRAPAEQLEDRALLATFVVTNTNDAGAGSLRDAIDQANATAAPDDIAFNIPAIGPTITLTSGEIPIDEELTINGTNLGADGFVTVNAAGNSRIFNTGGAQGLSVNFRSIFLTGGDAQLDGSPGGGQGGAVFDIGAALTFVDVSMTGNNAAVAGGAIFSTGGQVAIQQSFFGNNSSGQNGGAIFSNFATVDVFDSTLRNNSAGIDGGGIHHSGGALQQLTILRTLMEGNSADERGGGLFNDGIAASIATLWTDNSALTSGGAVHSERFFESVNSTFSANTAPDNFGGAIFNDNEITVTNSTLTKNVGSGIHNRIATDRTVNLYNSIVAGNINNITDMVAADLTGRAVETGSSFNFIGDMNTAGGLFDGIQGNIVGVPVLDDVLAPDLADNGGPTETHRIFKDTVLHNAGDENRAAFAGADRVPDASSGDVVLDNDQRGADPFVRSFDGVDIGAFEIQPMIVDLSGDESDGDFSSGDFSLREAIELANQSEGDDGIAFNIPEFSPVLIIEDQLLIDSELVIDGRNLSDEGGFITIDGDNDGRIFYVDGLTPAERTLFTLRNVTLQNGNANGVDPDVFDGNGQSLDFAGGAILNQFGIVEIINSGLFTNSADGSGGAILNADGGEVTIVNTTIGESSADISGGAIANESGVVSVVNATITANDSLVSGGGIHTAPANATTRLNNSIVAGNFNSTIAQDFSGGLVAAGSAHNLIGSSASAGGIFNGVDGNIVGNNGLGTIDVATVFNPVAEDNGGPSRSYALIDGSLALDAGDNNLAAFPGADFIPSRTDGDEAILSDTRDFPFLRIYNGTTDIGAYEDQFLTLPVSTPVDELDSNFGPGDFSMREALRFSNLNPRQDTILFDLGTSTTVTVDDELLVTRSVLIDGGNLFGPGVTFAGGNSSRILHVDGTTSSVEVDVSSIRFTGGNANGLDGGAIPSSGGAILNRAGDLSLDNVVIENNQAADSGGGIYLELGSLTLNNVTVRNNTAALLGGGLSNKDGAVDIITSTFNGNQSSSDGGAIFNNNGPLSVVNSTISNNASNLDAGGIYNEDDTVAIVNSTIVDNVADADGNGTGVGGGLYTVNDSVTFTNAFNSIFAGNTSGTGTTANDVGGKDLEAVSSNNIVADAATSAGLVDGVNGNIVGVGGSGTIALDTIVSPILTNNGGFVETHALSVGSPAVDQGDNNRSAIPGANSIPDVAGDGDTPIAFDQRGFPFVRTFGQVDIGSYEVTQEWVVTNASDVDDGNFAAGELTLREAIGLANATPASVMIRFDLPTVDPTIVVDGPELLINSSVVIDGMNADRGFVTLDGNSTGRIIKVNSLAQAITVGITNITLTNGIADGTDVAPFNNEGGGIFNEGGDLWVSNATITGNSAVENGGGIMSRGGSTTVWDTTFEANTADNGGGFFNFGGTSTVRDTTFVSNIASVAGGALLGRTGSVSVLSSTFTNNAADTGAAGANEIGADMHITNSTASGNRANSNGGAFENESGFLVLTNSTVAGNVADADDNGVGAGGGIWTTTGAGTRLFNTIVAGNTVEDPVGTGSLPNDLSGANVTTVSANNLIGNPATSGGITDGNNGNIVGDGGSTIDITTVLETTLASNGGSATLTHRLVPGSPAIDAGDSNRAALPGADGLPNISADGDEAILFDQRGTPYVRTTGNADIGAFEVTNDWVISTRDDVVDGVFGSGSYSLREAVEAANANPGPDTLTFDISLAGIDLSLNGSPIVITEDLTISGLGSGSTTIDGGGLSRIIHVAPGVTATLRHMTFTGGMSSAGGGAIYSEGELIVEDAIFDGNSANNGGALFVEGVTTVRRSLFTNNTAVYGGAIDSNTSQLNVYLENVTVSGNTATGSSGALAGAGIHIDNSAFTIINSTVANNTSDANADGAGIAINVANFGSLRMVNSIVADNITGSAAVDVAGELQLSHTLIEINDGYQILGNNIGNLNGDPGLGSLSLNHGQIPTHELASSSIAINAGDDTEVTFPTDQTGQPRQIRSVDMGAAERLLVAVNDFASTLITDAVNINVAGNDNPSTNLGVTDIVTDPSRGTAVINGSTIDYTPDQSLAPGQDQFSYEVGVATQTVETSVGGIRLGHAVAVDGDWMVSGALEFDNGAVPDVGAIFIYRRSGASWTLFDTITPDDGAVLDQFGYSVAIDGTTIVVGARKADAMGANSGAVYVYEFDATQGLWLQSAKLADTVDGSSGDQFGHAVAIQDDTIVVGARFDDGGGRNSGSIYVFNRTADGWTTTGRILAADGAQGDQLGYSLAIDGTTIVAGARKDNIVAIKNGAPKDIVDTGSVYVFENIAGTWTETANISNPDLRRNNWFGHSVDISGDNIAVGMPGRFTRFRTGEAFVFNRDTGGAGAWGNVAQIVDQSVDSETDRFGVSVAIDGETLVIGAERDDSLRDDAGKVYIHGQNVDGPNAWGLDSELQTPTPRENGLYGHAVAIDGTTVLGGAPAINTRLGRIHVDDLRREQAEVTVLISAPLQATEAGNGTDSDLNAGQLEPIVEAATQYWQNTPLTAAQQLALANVDVSVGSLGGLLLGTGSSRGIVIDDDAAGHGWYVDPTPFDQTDDNIGDRMDLLSVVTHELGHVIGHRDTYAANRSNEMMYGYLSAGESKLAGPTASLDMVFGQASELKDDLFAM